MSNASYYNELQSLQADSDVETLTQSIYHAHGWQQRYSNIIKLSRLIDNKPELQHQDLAIKGCESKLWLARHQQGIHHIFAFDADSRIIKGIAALVLLQLNNSSTETINEFNSDAFFESLDLKKHLSPSRSNGLYAFIKSLQSNQ